MSLRVLLLADRPGAETAGIRRWLEACPVALDARSLSDAGPTGGCDVLWVHAEEPVIEPDTAFQEIIEPLECGAVLLTGGAAALPFTLGIEPEPPNDAFRSTWHDAEDELFLFDSFAEFPRIRGHAAFRSHPLFQDLGSGTFTWAPREGETHGGVTYRAPAWPARGRVVAVERSYIHVNPDRATIWEYEAMEGAPATECRTLCIGAYLPLHIEGGPFHRHVRRLAWNALHYAAGRAIPRPTPETGALHAAGEVRLAREADAGNAVPDPGRRRGPRTMAIPTRHWRRRTPGPIEDPELDLPPTPELDPLPPFQAHLAMAGGVADDRPFTLAGSRAFLSGGEARGIDEIWVHPFRIAAKPRLRGAVAHTATVTPAGIRRELEVDGVAVTERVFVPPELPCALLEWTAAEPVSADLSFRADLRLMWPYPAQATVPRWRRDGRTLLLADGEDQAWYGFSAEPESFAVRDATSGGRSSLAVDVRLRLDPDGTRMVLACATDEAELDRVLRRLRFPGALVRAREGGVERRRQERLRLDAPDERAGAALAWAVERLASYAVETPGLGRSLVAGYWGSRDDWFHEGRPGYAWYFGRDAVWTALAALGAGDVDVARDVLTFLGAHQDLSGKILHECTTSGSVHYDAADATPLYLLLTARYHAWTGDAAFLREQWPRIEAAYRFCLSTDRDGDDLIENDGVGHGWIEFGRLGGGTVTYYNAGVWTAALRELGRAAESIGEPLAAELQARHLSARKALEATFWDPDASRYAINVRRPGRDAPEGEGGGRRWERNGTVSVMQAVPLLLGVADRERAAGWLDAMASDDFTAPWGVRMLPASDPDYDPESYHGGAVWPLYTGWAAWAEYAAGRGDAGFAHWMMNVELARFRQRGAWDEVLHGSERHAAGVCPDQAWSTAMAVSPMVYGLLGAEPDAAVGRLRLRPQLPAAWDRFEARHLRIGEAQVALDYRRDGHRHTFRVRQDRGAVPLTLLLEPVLRKPPANVMVDGTPAQLSTRPFGQGWITPVQLVLDAERVVDFRTGPDGGDPHAGTIQ